MKNVTLSIPGMQSAHCQARVNAAIKDIDGIKIERLAAGTLSASVENDEAAAALVAGIEKAGYAVEGTPQIADDTAETDSGE